MLLGGCTALPQPDLPPGDPVLGAARASRELAQLRGLPAPAALEVATKDREQLRESIGEIFQKEWGKHDEGLARAYRLFGLLPAELDVKRYLVELYTQQIAGYYDPEHAKLFVIQPDGGEGESAEEAALLQSYVTAHEVVHALQDQQFDLEALRKRVELENDRALATTALIEGDATLASFEHLIWRNIGPPFSLAGPLGRSLVRGVVALGGQAALASDRPDARALREAPDVIRSELLFAYLEGMAFVSALRSEFGWAAVDEAFRDPPESSEQILHPERYYDRRDRPVRITLAQGPPGWQPVFEETLGMLDLQVLLRTQLGGRAARNAEGWDGDRYVVWETGAGEALGWVTVWDHAYAARRFERSYRRALRRRHGREGPYTILRRSRVVVACEGGEAEARERAARALLESRIERAPEDREPDGPLRRLLLWPLAYHKLDRVREAQVLGGRVLLLRSHSGGHRFVLLNGLLARSERSPDRRQLSLALGLLQLKSDRRLGFRAGWIAPLLSLHEREVGKRSNLTAGLGHVPIFGPVLVLSRQDSARHLDLLGGLLLRLHWGDPSAPGVHLRLLRIPIPGF